jgi:hypothetical protein
LTPFLLSCTNYWKCWIRWQFWLMVVCHFAISFLSFFSIYGFWPPLWYLQALPTYQAKDLLAESCVTLDRLDYPHLFLIPRISIIWFTIFWFWVYIMKIIAQTLMCCVCFCDCSFCWYWRNYFNCLFIITSHLNYWIQKQSLNIHIHVL